MSHIGQVIDFHWMIWIVHGRLYSDLYDLYDLYDLHDLYDLACAAGWEPYGSISAHCAWSIGQFTGLDLYCTDPAPYLKGRGPSSVEYLSLRSVNTYYTRVPTKRLARARSAVRLGIAECLELVVHLLPVYCQHALYCHYIYCQYLCCQYPGMCYTASFCTASMYYVYCQYWYCQYVLLPVFVLYTV